MTKEAFQRVDIKKKYGVKRLRDVVERNLEGDRASPMKSTPSWVHELVPTTHEGVAKIHLERVERKGTWTVRYEFEDSFVVPADLPRAFRQKTKSSNILAKKRQAHRVDSSQSRGCLGVDEASTRFWRVSADSCSELFEEQDRALLV